MKHYFTRKEEVMKSLFENYGILPETVPKLIESSHLVIQALPDELGLYYGAVYVNPVNKYISLFVYESGGFRSSKEVYEDLQNFINKVFEPVVIEDVVKDTVENEK